MSEFAAAQQSRHLKSWLKEIDVQDLLDWVRTRPEVTKFYLKLRDENWEWAGVGNILAGKPLAGKPLAGKPLAGKPLADKPLDSHEFSMENAYNFVQTENLPDLKMFVAHTFDLDDSQAFFALPRVELTKDNGKTFLKINCWSDEDPPNYLDSISEKLSVAPMPDQGGSGGNARLHRADVPNVNEWERYFGTAQDFLKDHSKIVLARMTRATWQKPIDPFALLNSLRQESYRCYLRLPSGKEIVSVSPERLFKIDGHKLVTEAVAGTRPRGADEKEFLDSPKERAEHQYVVDEILRQIQPFCEKVEYPAVPLVAAFKKVLHLKTPMTATLKNHISFRQLIEALHPTPAVGGLPKTQSVSWLQKNEPFRREFYAAPVGMVGADKAEFFVNIRSVLIDGCELKLYSGVGVVKESNAESEWDEMDLKASQFWEALS